MSATIKHQTSRSHYQKYADLAAVPGRVEALSRRIVSAGITREVLEKAHAADRNLNNIELHRWDALAGPHGRWAGVRTLGEGVCLLKHIAVYHILGAEPDFAD